MDNKLQGKKILFKNKRFFLRFGHFCLFPRYLAKLLALLSPGHNSLYYREKRVAGVLPSRVFPATKKLLIPQKHRPRSFFYRPPSIFPNTVVFQVKRRDVFKKCRGVLSQTCRRFSCPYLSYELSPKDVWSYRDNLIRLTVTR